LIKVPPSKRIGGSGFDPTMVLDAAILNTKILTMMIALAMI
jgi:hypothetical protein